MSTAGKFINPPLIVLAYGTNERERLETLAQWAIIDVGKRCFDHWKHQIEAGDADEVLQATGRVSSLIAKLDIDADEWLETYTDEIAWALGVDTLGMSKDWRDAESCLASHQRLNGFFEQMRRATGRLDKRACYVRGLKLDWLMAVMRNYWEPEKWRGYRLSYSHFAALCAVLSKIGSNEPPAVTVTWPEIQRRALGYSSAAEMAAAMPFRQDGARPMSRDMIDRRTQQLALMEFFVRHVPMIGRKALPAWYGSGIDRVKLVKIAEAAKVKAKGGWKARWKAMQAKQTAVHDNIIAFESGLFPAHNERRDGNQQRRTGGERTA